MNDKKIDSQQPLDNLLTNFIETSFTAILVATSKGDIIWANNTCEQLFTTSKKRLQLYTIYDLLTPISINNQTLPKIDKINHLNESELEENSSHLTKTTLSPLVCYDQWITGTQQPLFVNYSVSLIEEAHLNKTVTDSQEKYLIELWQKDRHSLIIQEKQQQAQHSIARKMLRSVAHEVKNPLAGIRGAGQLLAKHLKNSNIFDTKSQTYTNLIINETDRLTSLINQLMGTKRQAKYHSLNIHQPIEHVVQLVASEEPTLKIVRDYDLSLPNLQADHDQLIQVFLNLAKNAIQATQARYEQQLISNVSDDTHNNLADYQPTISISTRIEFSRTIHEVKHKQVIKITMMDNGIGISEELIDQIFFPLVTGRAQGTGLGLSLAHEIIEQHQGQVEVESKFAQTIFNIYLPFS